MRHTWIAENVHQQGIGAVGAVEFPANAVRRPGYSSAGRINLQKSATPLRAGADPAIRSRKKIAVRACVFTVNDARQRAKRSFMWDGLSQQQVPAADVAA